MVFLPLLALVAEIATAAAPGLVMELNSVRSLATGNGSQVTLDAAGAIYESRIGPDMGTTDLVKYSPDGAVVYTKRVRFTVGLMRVDGTGSAYLTGFSSNVVAKLNPEGTEMVYEVRLGEKLAIQDMAVDRSGNAYVTGIDHGSSLRTTPNAFQPIAGSGILHPFIAKIGPSGTIAYATYLTGSGGGHAYKIGVDASGAALVLGSTSAMDFPVTEGAMLTTPPAVAAGQEPVFLARMKPDGTGLIFATFTGHASFWVDRRAEMAVDTHGSAWVAAANERAWQLRLMRFDPQGRLVTVSKTIPGDTGGMRLSVDAGGDLYLTATLGARANLPVRNSMAACNPDFSSFLMVLNSEGGTRLASYFPQNWEGGAYSLGANGVLHLFARVNQVPSVARFTLRDGDAPLALACVGNAASLLKGRIAAGEMISVFGEGLGSEEGIELTPEPMAYPNEASGVQVTFNGKAGPLVYAQHGQINALTPWDLDSPEVEICVEREGMETTCVRSTVTAAEPGVFADEDGYAVALNDDGTRNSARRPAGLGSVVTVLATGLGPLDPVPADGGILTAPTPRVLMRPSILVAAGITIGSNYTVEAISAAPVAGAVAGLFEVKLKAASGMLYLGMGEFHRSRQGFRLHLR